MDDNACELRDEIKALLDSGDMDLISSFGGGNNDGGLFAGSSIEVLVDGYSVDEIPFALVASLAAAPSTLARRAELDAWWAGAAGEAIRNAAQMPESSTLDLILVCDSD